MKQKSKKIEAAVFGATGLIGSKLIEFLKKDVNFKKIHLVLRSPTEFKDENVKIHKIDLFKKSRS